MPLGRARWFGQSTGKAAAAARNENPRGRSDGIAQNRPRTQTWSIVSHTPSARIVYLSSRHLASQLVSMSPASMRWADVYVSGLGPREAPMAERLLVVGL